MRRLVCLLVVLLVPAGSALAAAYGLGTFKGTVKALAGTQFAGGRRSDVTVLVKPGKVRIQQIGLIFDCPDREQYGLPPIVRATASSAFVHVRPGPAGGGAIAKPRKEITISGKTFTISGTIFMGLRSNKILGTVEAKLTGDGANCQDASRAFTAVARR